VVVVVVVRAYSVNLHAVLSFAHIGAENSVLYTKLVPCTDIYNAQFTSQELCTKFVWNIFSFRLDVEAMELRT
jgi:hypothetical protein